MELALKLLSLQLENFGTCEEIVTHYPCENFDILL